MLGFKNVLPNLPKLASDPVGEAITAGLNANLSSALTQDSNFELPTRGQIEAEALSKLKSTGELSNFSGLNKQLNFTKADGKTYLADLQNTPLYIVDSEPSNSDSEATMNPKDNTNELKVIITQNPTYGALNGIILTVMPTIQESRNATYDEVPILHHPGGILKYKNSSSRTWSVTGKLISRTMREAQSNLDSVNLIRSWVMPFYGQGTSTDEDTSKYIGAPPPILTLTAYGEKMIGPVPCVLENYSWTFPNDVDYINCVDTGNPFPVVLDITLTLKEAFSPAEYSGFSLLNYKNGNMGSAFQPVRNSPQQSPSSQPQQTPSELNIYNPPVSEPLILDDQPSTGLGLISDTPAA